MVGDGPLRDRLEASAPANTHILGRIGDATLAAPYAHCLALSQPPEEVFVISVAEPHTYGR